MKKGIVFFGAPGSGKGTQTSLFSDRLNIPVIGMGQILRTEVAKETELGKKIKKVLDRGEQLSKSDIMKVLEDELRQCDREWVLLDGVPRFLNQVEAVEQYPFTELLDIKAVIFLQIQPETVLERIRNRCSCVRCQKDFCHTVSVCKACGSTEFTKRSDDTEEMAHKRLQMFDEEISSILNFYKAKKCLYVVQADQPVEQVYEKILEYLTLLM